MMSDGQTEMAWVKQEIERRFGAFVIEQFETERFDEPRIIQWLHERYEQIKTEVKNDF